MHSCIPSRTCKIQQSSVKVNLLLHLLRVKRSVIIWIFLLSLGVTAFSGFPVPTTPVNGTLDLTSTVLNDQTIINLNGEWLFFWEEFLTPDNYTLRKSDGMAVSVPSYWSSYKIDGENLSGMGYGTYSLQIIIPEGYQSSLCFDIPVFDVAYKLYLNDRLMSSNGEVGISREDEKPWYDPSSFCYIPDGDTLQLLIQVSNFHHRRGGFWQTMYMGGSEKVLGRRENQRIYNYSTVGVLFFFMLFFLIFWSFNRKEVLMLLFALTTLGMLIRAVNTGLYVSNAFLEASWSWQIRMEYLGSYLAMLFGMMLLHKLFPNPHMNKVIRINTIVLSLASASLFILPVRYFTYEMMGYQPLLVVFLAHYLATSFAGTLKRKVLDGVFFVSLPFLFLHW